MYLLMNYYFQKYFVFHCLCIALSMCKIFLCRNLDDLLGKQIWIGDFENLYLWMMMNCEFFWNLIYLDFPPLLSKNAFNSF